MKKPEKTTADGERANLVDFQRKAVCDLVMERAYALMVESGASGEMIVDRMLTHTTYRSAALTPPERLAHAFREHADEVASGVFHKPSDADPGRQH